MNTEELLKEALREMCPHCHCTSRLDIVRHYPGNDVPFGEAWWMISCRQCAWFEEGTTYGPSLTEVCLGWLNHPSRKRPRCQPPARPPLRLIP